MTPDLGQGACQAIEDAMELANSLAKATTVTAGLQEYEARRIARTRTIVLGSRRMGKIGQTSSAMLCALRDAAFRLTPRSVTLGSIAPIIGFESHLSR